jgi:hypothetical protein
MYQTYHKANGRTPQPECCAVAGKINMKWSKRNSAEHINARDDA